MDKNKYFNKTRKINDNKKMPTFTYKVINDETGKTELEFNQLAGGMYFYSFEDGKVRKGAFGSLMGIGFAYVNILSGGADRQFEKVLDISGMDSEEVEKVVQMVKDIKQSKHE